MAARTQTTPDGCLVTEVLVDFVEGRFEAAARARVEEHASHCNVCRQVLSSLARSGPPRSAPPRVEPSHDLALAPGSWVGRYLIAHEIGRGGMGVIYAAHDPELDRVVAVKVLRGDSDPRLGDRLRREAQAMAQLAHPNVVAVYDVGSFDGRMFIAMEYVAGETLARWLETPRSRREILEAYGAAGRGLAAAHAAGIVHRDFKPENVLIGHDGRVRVGDFGLARAFGAAELLHSAETAPGSRGLASSHACMVPFDATASGTLLGTPFYMAPELYGGSAADTRSDQFSFSVALFTALGGERPFDGDDLEALAVHIRAGRVRDARVRVRRRVRAALRRGLAPDPAARFASLDELLAELAPPPRRTARWAIGLAGAVAAGALVLTWSAEAPDQRCTGAAAAFATAWHPAQRAAIAAAFTRTGAPYAPTALSRVTDALDHYGARWTRAHTDACRATRILGEQTDAILELRMTCLERRRQEVAALVGALATANADAVARSVTAALGLVDVAACADLAALRQLVAPPTDVARRARLDGLTPRLAEARASFETGAFDRAQQLIGPVVAEARALAYRPFEAEALFLEGEIEHAKGNRASEEATYQAAVWAAEAGGHDEVAARAWARLVYVIGYDKAEFARGLALAPLVTAKLAKLGGNAAIEAELEHSTAGVVLAQGNPESAIAHVRKAIDIADHAFGPDHAKVAIELLALGSVLANEGRPASAVPILQRAYDIRARAMGPDHPDTLTVLNALANAHNDTGHPAQAEQELRRALALREAALGSQHPMLVYNLANLATALDDQGKTEEAVALDHRAVALAENVFGPEHLRLGILLVDAAVHLGHLGRLREARDQLQRADAIFTKLHGAHAIESQFVQVVRGDLRFRESRWADAAALYEQAIPVLEGAHIVHNEVTVAVIHLGLAGLELHQPARGLPALERLAARLDEVRPDLRVAGELTLARALWDSGRDRKRARELASHALAAAHQLPGAHRDDAAQIERWLARH